jgi:DnaJ-class molecular chaperone
MDILFTIIFGFIVPFGMIFGLHLFFDHTKRIERERQAKAAMERKEWEERQRRIRDALEYLRMQAEAAARQARVRKPKTVPWYTFLGVKENASVADINRAYKQKAMVMHPDKGGSVRHMQSLNKAREIGLRVRANG